MYSGADKYSPTLFPRPLLSVTTPFSRSNRYEAHRLDRCGRVSVYRESCFGQGRDSRRPGQDPRHPTRAGPAASLDEGAAEGSLRLGRDHRREPRVDQRARRAPRQSGFCPIEPVDGQDHGERPVHRARPRSGDSEGQGGVVLQGSEAPAAGRQAAEHQGHGERLWLSRRGRPALDHRGDRLADRIRQAQL